MGKGVKKQALQNSGYANDLSKAANSNATSLYSQLNPIYSQEATNPKGFAPEDLAAMNTASQQSIGGSVAGATGQGNLEAARTRNAGGFAPAVAESARSGMRENSDKALEIQANNALQKERERTQGLAGLSGLYGNNSAQALNALGLSNQALGVANNSSPSAWQQFGSSILNTAGKGIGTALTSVPGIG